jgi:SanA protein
MRQALIENGIPPDRIFLDYAGFRTFDSVFRADKIFGQKKFTIISQDFHTRRAIYIARHLGLDAIGFNAQDVSRNFGFKTQLREKFARTNMFLDFIFSAKPKFLGEKIRIE